MTGIRIELDRATSELLLAVHDASDEPEALVAAADLDPAEFEDFLARTGRLDDPVAQELLHAARSRRPSQEKSGPSAPEDAWPVRAGRFDMNDFVVALRQFQHLGPLEPLLKLMSPGMSNLRVKPERLKHIEAIVGSMTPREREHPESLNGSRRVRIAHGSGRPVSEVNRVLEQFRAMQNLRKQVERKQGGIPKLPFGGGIPRS